MVDVVEGEQPDEVGRVGLVDVHVGRPDLLDEGLGVTAEQVERLHAGSDQPSVPSVPSRVATIGAVAVAAVGAVAVATIGAVGVAAVGAVAVATVGAVAVGRVTVGAVGVAAVGAVGVAGPSPLPPRSVVSISSSLRGSSGSVIWSS